MYFLYFSWIALICGATRCIFNIDFICESRNGSRARLITSVCNRIAQPQFATMWVYIHFSHKNKGRAIIPSQPKSMIARRSGSAPVMPGTGTDSKSDNAFGPTYSRASLGPLRLPTAAPSTSTLSMRLSSLSDKLCGISIALRSVTIAVFFGSCGDEDGCEILVRDPGPVKRSRSVPPLLIFLMASRSTLSSY